MEKPSITDHLVRSNPLTDGIDVVGGSEVVIEDDGPARHEVGNDRLQGCSRPAVVVRVNESKKDGLIIQPSRCRFKDVPSYELDSVGLGVGAHGLEIAENAAWVLV